MLTGAFAPADAAEAAPSALAASFEQDVQPFLQRNCVVCHNESTATSGVRLDSLDSGLADRHLRLWETVQERVRDGTMPPEGAPQPTAAERREVAGWIEQALDFARSRPVPKNGLVRRLTVSQYRNTLRELLLLEDDLTDILPPDAVSEDGFLNNSDTLQLSPLLMEAYFEIAAEALDRTIVDPRQKPSIQNFRAEFGKGVNPAPLPEKIILGAGNLLLDNADFVVTQPVPSKPFAFDPRPMRTSYRFHEGYNGNATVRGWREFDSIYHVVFACMRGSRGYPKGNPYDTVPEGLLLRPAIPTDEIFRSDGTFGPKANFKLSVRELPDHGRFRVTVTAAKYRDGLLLEPGEPAQDPGAPGALTVRDPQTGPTVTIERAGVYQVDAYEASRLSGSAPADASRLDEGLIGSWKLDADGEGRPEGDARLVDSPFGRALSLDGYDDSLVIPGDAARGVGSGDFTVAAWIRPEELRRAGVVALGGNAGTRGWYLEVASNRGSLRLETTGPGQQSNGSVTSPQRVLRADAWQHVAAVVRRGGKRTRLYVNGFAVARGAIHAADLDNPDVDLHLGSVPEVSTFFGEIDDVRIYRRALGEPELRALLQPGASFVRPPPSIPQELTLSLGDRTFSGPLEQPAFLAVRLEEGPLRIRSDHGGIRELDRVALTPLEADHPLVGRLEAFEARTPRVGVHLGLRRDCGSTFARVGTPQPVPGEGFQRFVFEGAVRDFPSPEVSKGNVNYLAGMREIGVRSEYTDGRDMPRLLIRSVEFEGPFYESWPPAPHRSIFFDPEREDGDAAYARAIIGRFASRAFRRPVSAEEKSALMAVFERSSAAGGGFQESVKDALLVALTSPQFLFLVEASDTPEPEPLDDYELASKLAYFLWNGPPDRRTLDLAGKGELRAHLDAEVDRMIADPRFSRFVGRFAAQWLSLDKFDVLEPDSEQFPKLTRDARVHLRREPAEFLQHLMRRNLPVRNLIDSDFLVANEAVASYYDLGDRTESGFEFVPIRHERPGLGGVLSQAAILAGLSDGRESNPVKRGAWLARKIIAEPPDDPPPNVPDLEADTAGLSLRERLEQHRSQPGCMQCHTKIDPWGVPFEEYDAGGRLKLAPVDARSMLPDSTEVAGVADLKRYLAEDRIDQVAFSVLKHLAIYANGRSLEYGELNYLQQDGASLRADGYRMQDMIRYTVKSKFFLEK